MTARGAIESLLTDLTAFYGEREAAWLWLVTPQAALGGAVAFDLIAGGAPDEPLRVVAALMDGVYA